MTGARYLLDTHTVLWAAHADKRLPAGHAEIIGAGEGLVISVVTLWEIAIKRSLNKLMFDGDILGVATERSIPLLRINEFHATATETLPFHHRDPFDRLLIAQAQVEDLTILTTDRHFALYDVRVG